MEIERKWMVTGWPEGLTQTSDYQMDQGYVSVRPTVRIRREALQGGRTALVLCFKGAGTLSREEIETEIDAELFAKLEHLIGKPLIRKERRGYRLPGGLTLEVNCVDPDLPTPPRALPTTCTTNAPASPAAVWESTGFRRENNPRGRQKFVFVKSPPPPLQTPLKRLQY